jgi:hypothetical protein
MKAEQRSGFDWWKLERRMDKEIRASLCFRYLVPDSPGKNIGTISRVLILHAQLERSLQAGTSYHWS